MIQTDSIQEALEAIRDERQTARNTANRIGSAMLSLLSLIRGMARDDSVAIATKLDHAFWSQAFDLVDDDGNVIAPNDYSTKPAAIRAKLSLFSDYGLSALGQGSSSGGSGGSGIDIDTLWSAMATNDTSRQIHSSHLATALQGYLTADALAGLLTIDALTGYATEAWVQNRGFGYVGTSRVRDTAGYQQIEGITNISFVAPSAAGETRGFRFNGVTDAAALYYIEPSLADDGRMRFLLSDNPNDCIEMAWELWNVPGTQVAHTFTGEGYIASGILAGSEAASRSYVARPYVNDFGSLGTSSYRWHAVYASELHGTLESRNLWGNAFDGSRDVNGKIAVDLNSSSEWTDGMIILDTAMPADGKLAVKMGKEFSSFNSATFTYHHDEDGSASNRLSLGFVGRDFLLSVYVNGKTVASGPLEVNGYNETTGAREASIINGGLNIYSGTLQIWNENSSPVVVRGNMDVVGDHLWLPNALVVGDGRVSWNSTDRMLTAACGLHVSNALRIGDAKLSWDSANNALRLERADGTAASLYATGGVSALGFGTGSSSGGIDMATVWTALGASSSQQIALSHLRTALGSWRQESFVIGDLANDSNFIYGNDIYVSADYELSLMSNDYLNLLADEVSIQARAHLYVNGYELDIAKCRQLGILN